MLNTQLGLNLSTTRHNPGHKSRTAQEQETFQKLSQHMQEQEQVGLGDL